MKNPNQDASCKTDLMSSIIDVANDEKANLETMNKDMLIKNTYENNYYI